MIAYSNFMIADSFNYGIYDNTEYKTYSISNSKLYVASSSNGVLFAGLSGKNPVRCSLDEVPLKNGVLICDIYKINIKNGNVIGLELIDSFDLVSNRVAYKYNDQNEISRIVYCSGNSRIQNSLEMLYDRNFDCNSVAEVFMQDVKNSFNEYIKGKDNVLEFLLDSPIQEKVTEKLFYFDDRILVFLNDSSLYTGGAHGSNWRWGTIVSRDSDVVYLEEIIDLNNIELKEILWEKYEELLKKNKLDYSVDFVNFRVSDMMLLDYDGIYFLYQPYELLPYSYGVVAFKLLFSEVRKFGSFDKSQISYLFTGIQ